MDLTFLTEVIESFKVGGAGYGKVRSYFEVLGWRIKKCILGVSVEDREEMKYNAGILMFLKPGHQEKI